MIIRGPGIHPTGSTSEALGDIEASYKEIAKGLKPYAARLLYVTSRKQRFSRKIRRQEILKKQFRAAFTKVPDFAREVGLNPDHEFEVDLTVPTVRYCVSKRVDNAATRKRTTEFLAQ